MQTAKGLLVIGALVILFLATPFRRDVVALAAAGSFSAAGVWPRGRFSGSWTGTFLVLFIGLFGVNGVLGSSVWWT